MYKLLQQWTSRWNIPRFSIIFEITFWVFLGIQRGSKQCFFSNIFQDLTYSWKAWVWSKHGFNERWGSYRQGGKLQLDVFFFCRGCRLEQSQGGARRIGGEGKGSCVLCLSPSTRWGTEWPIGAGTFALRACPKKKSTRIGRVADSENLCLVRL